MKRTRLLQEYVRDRHSNPPGDTRKAAEFLASIFEREGIPFTRYESAPGKAIIYARLKATVSPPAGKAIVLLHHMDVVPADRAQWKLDPFGATIQGNELWGRGAMDMKGAGHRAPDGVPQAEARAGAAVPRRDPAGGAGRRSRRRAGRALDDREPLRGARSGVRDRRRRLRQPRPVRAREAGLRHLGRRKEDRLAEAARRRGRRPRQPAARSEPERSARQGAGAVARREPDSSAAAAAAGRPRPTPRVRARRHEGARRDVRGQQVHQRDPAFDDRAHLVPVGRRRSAEDQRDPVGRRGRARLPRAARDDEGPMDRRGPAPPRRPGDRRSN